MNKIETIRNHKKIILWPLRQDDTWLFMLPCLEKEFYKGFTEIYTTILMCVISKYHAIWSTSLQE